VERFMAVQAEISREKLARRIGQRLTVLVDEVGDDEVIARSYADAPEIDGEVIIAGAWELDPGDFIEVEVTDASDHDLWAQPIAD
jgi:ribosomal protein S12 methylthiotransferase